MAMRDITEKMSAYRECSRNLWNVYFSRQQDIGAALDGFEQIRNLLFNSLVAGELAADREAEGGSSFPNLRVVPRERSIILIRRVGGQGENRYWDEEKDMVVGPGNISLAFVDYFDFSQIPIMDFHFFLCKILSFPGRSEYEGREALIKVVDGRVFHDEGD